MTSAAAVAFAVEKKQQDGKANTNGRDSKTNKEGRDCQPEKEVPGGISPLEFQWPFATLKVTKERIARIEPDQVDFLLRNCRYQHQRPRSEHTVERYSDVMRAGRFGLSVGWIAWVGDDPALIDMQHRLEGCKKAGAPFEIIVVETFHETDEERDQVYANRDRGKDRTPADYIRAAGYQDLKGLDQNEANRTASAITFLVTGFGNNYPGSASPVLQDVMIRVKFAVPFQRAAQRYFEMIRRADRDLQRRLSRAAIVACGLVTMEYASHIAEPFWRRIADNDNLKKNSPEWWMVNKVLSSKYAASENLRLTRAIARLWNAHADDRTLPELRPEDEAKPIEFRGTPYSKREVFIPESLMDLREMFGFPVAVKSAPAPGAAEPRRRGRPLGSTKAAMEARRSEGE